MCVLETQMWDLGCVCVCAYVCLRDIHRHGTREVCSVCMRACVSKRHTQMWDLGRHAPGTVLRSYHNLDPTNFSSLGAMMLQGDF